MSAGPPKALAGLRVLELGSLIAGPYAASLLAQFGAEVVKIESPENGDPLRQWRKMHQGTSLWWYSQSRNKKSVALDLRRAEGAALVRELAAGADVVIENFRPGTLEKWGLGWETLSAANPKLVMLRISGYGQDGPYAGRPGFAAVAECMGGLRHVTGFPDRPPVRAGVSLGDTLASLYGSVGALMALLHARAGGQGQVVDVALYEAVFAVMESLMPEYSVQGHVRERSGASLPGIAPSNTYVCRDGRYVAIAGNGDSIFLRLMRLMGRSDLAGRPELAGNEGRVRHAGELDAAIQSWTLTLDAQQVIDRLNAEGVPGGAIYTAADIAADPHFRARGMLEAATLPDGTPVTLPGAVPRLCGTPARTEWLGPRLGEHTFEVLSALGVGDARLRELESQGVIA